MIKLIWRRACLLLLASMLMGAMLGAFNSTNTFAQEIFYDGYDDSGGGGGGGTYYCPSPSGCGNFGCHARSIADHTQICSQYRIDAAASCPSPIDCSSGP